MADNTTLDPAAGGDTIATDDIGGIKFQRIKLIYGGDGVNSGDVATANPLPVVQTGALPAGTNNIGDVDVLTLPALPAGTNAIGKLAANSGVDIGDVDVTSVSGNVTVIQGTASALKVEPAGNVAHDAADSGNPVKIGLKALAVGAAPTAVATGDRTDAYANTHGVQFVMPGHPACLTYWANYTSTQTNAAIITQAAGGKLVITGITVAADNENSINPSVRIGLGTASTPSGAQVVFSHPGIPAGFHCPQGFSGGVIAIGADNEDLRITTGAISGTCSIDCLVSYYVLAT